MKLVKEERLKAGLEDWSHRNQLMRELNLIRPENKNAIEKWGLAFLLGEKSAYNKLVRSGTLEYIKRAQYIVICLDRLINNLSVQGFDTNHNAQTLKRLKKTRFSVLNYFNLHFSMEPKEAFSELAGIIHTQLLNVGVDDRTKQMVAHLRESIHLICDHYVGDSKLSEEEKKKTYPNYPALIQAGSDYKRFGMKVIMGSNDNQWFLNRSYIVDSSYDFQTLYLCSRDGTTVDGLWLKKKGVKKKSVVLALVGHFQSEHTYLSNSQKAFYKLFNTDIIFINPRNYSQHAGIKANGINDIVSDIGAFSDFASQKYKHMILYGMCGGVPFMTMAAEQLELEKNSYKVIVDRFSDSYSNIYSARTINRNSKLDNQTDFIKFKNTLKKDFKILSYFPDFSFNLFLTLFSYGMLMTKESLMMLLGLQFSLADILKNIPFEKRLILQAKSKKIIGEDTPQYTDRVVHPLDDMRHAFKARRHQKRIVLKNLSNVCLDVAVILPAETSIYLHMMKLSEIFRACLHTIDNEKLKYLDVTSLNKGVDLHPYKLFDLKTRNNQPIDQFIQAFCLFKSDISKKTLYKLYKLDNSTLHYLLNINLPDFDVPDRLVQLVKEIIDTIFENREFIVPLAERVSVRGRYDLGMVLKGLASLLQDKITPNPEIMRAMEFAK